MARKVFYSFHYVPDAWRASQVRNIGVVEGNRPASDNDWEAVKSGGDAAVQRWIDEQLAGRTCTIVLIGTNTAGRKWITYEIQKSWNDAKGVVGIYVHNLKDGGEHQSAKGGNPLQYVSLKGTPLSSIVRAYDPPFSLSTSVYDYIKQNLDAWVEEAVAIRGRY
jgi:hypothetical protein